MAECCHINGGVSHVMQMAALCRHLFIHVAAPGTNYKGSLIRVSSLRESYILLKNFKCPRRRRR